MGTNVLKLSDITSNYCHFFPTKKEALHITDVKFIHIWNYVEIMIAMNTMICCDANLIVLVEDVKMWGKFHVVASVNGNRPYESKG
jgi:hypothetical protein